MLNPMVLGAIGGSLLGGLGGSKQTGTQTTVQDIPAWLKPYAMGMMQQAQPLFNASVGGAGPILGASQDEMLKTIKGDYLNPDTNPYLARTFEQGAAGIRSALSPKFGHMQAFGSGGNQFIGRSIADFGQNLFGNNYNAERNRQFSATGQGQQFAFEPFQQYKGLMGNFGGQTQTPIYENRGANLLGGALSGAMMGRMFGGA